MILTRHRGLDLTEILSSKLTDHLPEEVIPIEARTHDIDIQEGTPSYDTESSSDIPATHLHPFVEVLGTKGGL